MGFGPFDDFCKTLTTGSSLIVGPASWKRACMGNKLDLDGLCKDADSYSPAMTFLNERCPFMFQFLRSPCM